MYMVWSMVENRWYVWPGLIEHTLTTATSSNISTLSVACANKACTASQRRLAWWDEVSPKEVLPLQPCQVQDGLLQRSLWVASKGSFDRDPVLPKKKRLGWRQVTRRPQDSPYLRVVLHAESVAHQKLLVGFRAVVVEQLGSIGHLWLTDAIFSDERQRIRPT